jgi:hypothetical protein
LSCDYDVSCPPRVAFRGSTGNQPVSVGAVAGGEVSLMVVMVAPCPAGKEVFYYPSLPDEPCSTVCIQGEVACDGISGGCLCFYPSATPDAGR